MNCYKLDENKKAVPCTLNEFSDGLSDRVMKQEAIGEAKVSTVFLGLDHNFMGGEPVLFETMIFGGKHGGYQKRCSTWEMAEKMHQDAVALVEL